MNISETTAITALTVTVISNVIAIIIYMARQAAILDTLKSTFEEFKREIKEKVREGRLHTEEQIKRLEQKQDKHNTLIERMAIVEQAVKSAHHRIDDIKGAI